MVRRPRAGRPDLCEPLFVCAKRLLSMPTHQQCKCTPRSNQVTMNLFDQCHRPITSSRFRQNFDRGSLRRRSQSERRRWQPGEFVLRERNECEAVRDFALPEVPHPLVPHAPYLCVQLFYVGMGCGAQSKYASTPEEAADAEEAAQKKAEARVVELRKKIKATEDDMRRKVCCERQDLKWRPES